MSGLTERARKPDEWVSVLRLWPCRRWVPFGPVRFTYEGDGGSGPFAGWCWRVVWELNGRANPMIPEGVAWAKSRDVAVSRARKHIAVDRQIWMAQPEVIRIEGTP